MITFYLKQMKIILLNLEMLKTKQEQNIPLYDIIKNLPVAEGSEIPLVSKEILEGLYSAIYKNEDTSFFENINNPSSGNPSSKQYAT